MVFDLLRWVVLAAVVLLLISTFWFTFFVVDGVSMEPNLGDKEIVLLQKNAYIGERKPNRGDAVVVQYPGDPEHKRYVKRVIGLPGEQIAVKRGRVYADGKILTETYLPFNVVTEPVGQWNLDQDQYFLMGDNRSASNDSRFFGGVEKRFFMGKATMIVFPRLRFLRDI